MISDSEAPAHELLKMWGTHSLPLLPGPLSPWAVAFDRVLSMGQIERVQTNDQWQIELLEIELFDY